MKLRRKIESLRIWGRLFIEAQKMSEGWFLGGLNSITGARDGKEHDGYQHNQTREIPAYIHRADGGKQHY